MLTPSSNEEKTYFKKYDFTSDWGKKKKKTKSDDRGAQASVRNWGPVRTARLAGKAARRAPCATGRRLPWGPHSCSRIMQHFAGRTRDSPAAETLGLLPTSCWRSVRVSVLVTLPVRSRAEVPVACVEDEPTAGLLPAAAWGLAWRGL